MSEAAAHLPPRARVVAAVGSGQLLAWASSYYVLAILAKPMAASLGVSPPVVYAFFSAALLLAAALGPFIGARIDRYGGRNVLLISNGIFALGLLTLAAAPNAVVLALGWLIIGAGMPMGLYDAAFSTLVSLYKADARRSIVGVTLIAGFASSVSWPLTAALDAHWGWRAACAFWAALHLSVGPAIHGWLLPDVRPVKLHAGAPPTESLTQPAQTQPLHTYLVLGVMFAAHGFIFAALASHLPRVLMAAGCAPAAAVAAASLVGIAQVSARLTEAGLLSRLHPLASARIATAMHPLGAISLGLIGAPAAMLFTALHGAGIGLMTIIKGTLPLALFGTQGFGRRAALLEVPSRVAQALAPLVFGLGLEAYGDRVLWLSGAIGCCSFLGLASLRLKPQAG